MGSRQEQYCVKNLRAKVVGERREDERNKREACRVGQEKEDEREKAKTKTEGGSGEDEGGGRQDCGPRLQTDH